MVASGDITLRKEFIDTAVKAVALREYKLRTLCTVDSSSAYTESYWRETNTDPTTVGVATSANGKLKGTPALAPFVFGSVAWTKVTGINEKYAVEGMISYEDEQLNYLPMIERTILRLGRGVAKAVDDQIAAVMLASAGNTFAITAGNEWDSATIANRDPVFDILYGIDMIRKDNIDPLTGDGYLVVNGTDYTNLISNSKIMNNPTFKTADVVSNGVVGEICGLKIMVTEALEVTTPDVAYIVMKNGAMVWKSVTPLTVEQIKDPGIKTTIRAWEIGHCQMVSPNGVCKITNTRK
jgi:hypothetical protein